MLRDAWLPVSAVIVIAGVIATNAAVVAAGVIVGMSCYGATLWASHSLRRLYYDRLVPEDHAFPGDTLEADLRVTNGKRLPLPWLEITERFSTPLVRGDDPEFSEGSDVGYVRTSWRTSVGGRQRVSRRYTLECPERGLYEIGPARLASGDPFGLSTSERGEEHRTRVVVYPRTVNLGAVALPARRPYGEETGGIRLFEDPSRTAGLRDYQPGDDRRRIDWNATARLGRMQTRVYDPASSRQVLICLNLQTTVPIWAGVVPDVFERSISVAATIARDAYERRHVVGLLANGTLPEAGRTMRIPPGRRPEQFIRILEALAMIPPFIMEPLHAMLAREEHRLAPGTTLAVVTGLMTDELAGTLLRLARRGYSVVVFSTTGERWDDKLPGIDVRDVSTADSPWRGDGEPEAAR
jgi:uncharacterized protein (DUF58 family)